MSKSVIKSARIPNPSSRSMEPSIAFTLAGLFLLFISMRPPQIQIAEARVLETAREMVGQDWHGWMFPRLDGVIRTDRPPLAAWLSAACFSATGVSQSAGRIPAASAAWATVGCTFLIARRKFGTRIAWGAAAALLGTYVFLSFALLARPESLLTLFVTCGYYAVMRSSDPKLRVRWQHLFALNIALAILTIGPIAGLLFLILPICCGLKRDWRPLREFFTFGAIVTLLVISVPWFVYVGARPSFGFPFVSLVVFVPAGAIALGWALDRTIDSKEDFGPRRAQTVVRTLLVVLFYLLMLAPIAVYLMAKQNRLAVTPDDYAVIAVLGVLSVAAGRFGGRGRWSTRLAWLGALAVGASAAAAIWIPTLTRNTPDTIASQIIAKYPGADYVFRNGDDPTLSFAMRQVIPPLSEQELIAHASSPATVCIERGSNKADVNMPAGYHETLRFIDRRQFVAVYVPNGQP